MPTSRSFISNNIPTQPTTVYTNTSGGPAVLKSINITGSGTSSGTFTSTGADEWSYFGTNIPTFISTSAKTGKGFDIPMPVQLSDNRVLLVSLPHNQHLGGTLDYFSGTRVHTQVVEYTGTKYRAGPIVDIVLPTAVYSSITNSLWSSPDGMTTPTYTQPNFRMIALSSTKVVCVYRQGSDFQMIRLTISGNSVSQTTTTFNLAGATAFNNTTAGAFELAPVPGYPNKVVVGGYTATNWSVQSYNVPDSGNITVASNLFSTGVAASVFGYTLTNLTRSSTYVLSYTPGTDTFVVGDDLTTTSGGTGTVGGVDVISGRLFLTAATGTFTPGSTVTGTSGATGTVILLDNAAGYISVGATTATTASAQMLNYNPVSDAFSLVSTAVVYTRTTQISGIESACLSTGTNANAVVALIDTGAPNTLGFYRQLSFTTPLAAASVTSLTLQHAGAKSITTAFQWGNERAVFVGENSLLAVFDSAGVATNLLPSTETTADTRIYQQWIPFNSRPLYTLYDTGIQVNRVPQYYSRTNITSTTSVGTTTFINNYFPWGHDYGGAVQWNDVANCWIVGQGGRIYSLSSAGEVLDEVSTYNLSTLLNYTYTINQLAVSSTGLIYFSLEPRRASPGQDTQVQWTSLSGTTLYAATTVAVTDSTGLSRTALISTPTSLTGYLASHLVAYTDSSNTQKAILLYLNSTTMSFSICNAGTWGTAANTSTVTAINTANSYGHRIPIKLIQETPVSAANTDGLWRLVGATALNNVTNQSYKGISTNYAPSSLTSANVATNTFATAAQLGYGITSKQSSQIAVVSFYDATKTSLRSFASVAGRLANTYGWLPPTLSSNLQFSTIGVAKYVYIVGINNGTTSAQQALGYLFNFLPPADPIQTVTTTSGNGMFTMYAIDELSVQVFGTGVDVILSAPGPNNTVNISVVLQDSTSNNFSVINQQALSSSALSNFRNTDTYIIPNNWAIKLQAESPNSFNALLNIVEEV